MALDLDILAVIDARIKAGEQNILAFGTIASVNSINDVTVTFDGSAASIACKTFGDVPVVSGDRVGLAKIGKWWTVIGTMSRRWQSDYGSSLVSQATGGSTTSLTAADLPDLVGCTFPKLWDETKVKVTVHASCYSDVIASATVVDFGTLFTSTTTTVSSGYSTCEYMLNNNSIHYSGSNVAYIPGLPAAIYTVKLQWRRVIGSATLIVDQWDRIGISVAEVSP